MQDSNSPHCCIDYLYVRHIRHWGSVGCGYVQGQNQKIEILALGKEMFRNGSYEEARKVFENAITLDSKNSQAHYFLGLLDYEKGDIEKAISRFR